MSEISIEAAVPEERLMAAAAHGSCALPFLGMLVSLEIWLTQRKWSRFAAFHALQALLYQQLCSAALLVLGLPGAVLVPAWLWVQLLGRSSQAFLAATTLLVLWLALLFLAGLLLAVPGLLAAAAVLRGRDIRLPVIGSRLETWLQEPL